MNLHRPDNCWPPPCRRVLPALLLAGAFAACAQSTNAPLATDFSSFQIIAERNIFNPHRRPHSTRPRPHEAPVNAFALVGTLDYRKGRFAFFDGTSSEYRKVLEPDGTIAGYKLLDITLDGVTLAAGGKEISMEIGSQMRQEAPGHWQLTDQATFPLTSREAAAAAPESSPTNPASSAGGQTSDVLKRLMQQRAQELK